MKIAALALFACGAALAADEAPRWVTEAVGRTLPVYGKEVPAVVMLDEETVSMEESGKILTESRWVLKILSREGRSSAHQSKEYESGASKIREMRAWLISPAGQVHKLGKEDTVETSVSDVDLYSDMHVRGISVTDKAEPGSVFAFESTVEEKSVFTQFDWAFQGRLPVLRSHYTVNLPSGWEARSVTFNHAPVVPAVSGSSYSWELGSLPYMEHEPASPQLSSLVPRVAVSVLPSGGRTPGRAFTNWAEVSAWISELHDPQASVTRLIEEKARSLTADSKTDLERVQAIAKYVQGTRYIEISMNLGRGGGMKPHAATEALAKSYGDCKDKANLMRALLKAVNIESYPVIIYSGDPDYVREEWPSPQQFNHCILAIALKADAGLASTVKHPALGALLVFDPTDPFTPVGDLPPSDRNSLALIAAGKQGALLRMPSPPGSRTELNADLKLDARGVLTGTVHETSYGGNAVAERAYVKRHDRAEFRKSIEAWFTDSVPAARLDQITTTDEAAGQFRLDIDFAAPAYGQLMQGRMLVFRPGVVGDRGGLTLTQPTRKYPIMLREENYSDTFRIEIPDGFAIDELPDGGKLETPYGTFRMAVKAEGNTVTLTRSLELKTLQIPPAEYAKVKDFFSKIAGAQASPVVLAKK